MPTLPIDDAGNVLYFEDSGPPPNASIYTTIVLIHGLIFHGGVYKPMIPHAHAYNLRFVILNMRDYPGSSAYTPAEMEAITSSSLEVQRSAIQKQGKELAMFLLRYIESSGIPPKTESAKERTVKGGLAVLTWSMSNIVGHSLLAHADELEEGVKETLGKYLRTIVLYAVSATGLGQLPRDAAAQLYSPFRDPNLSQEERIKRFTIWVSSYFPPVSDLSGITLEDVASRKAVHLDNTLSPEEQKRPTVERMSSEEFQAMTDVDALTRSSQNILRANPEIYRENFERAHWHQDDDKSQSVVWPQLKILVVWCGMDVGDCLWAVSRFREKLDTTPRIRRPVSIQSFPFGNHFMHWEDPKEFTSFLALNIDGVASTLLE